MIDCEVELKKWGNSIGLIVPKDGLKRESLRDGQKVRAIITPLKTLKVKDVFGKQKLRRPTAELMAELDNEFEKTFGK